MNFIKRIMMLAIAVLCLSFAAKAENKLYFKDFNVVADGETETVAYLYMDYDNPDLGGFQCDIYLPDGLSFAKFSAGTNKLWIVEERDFNKKVDGYDALLFLEQEQDGFVRILCGNISGGAGVPIKGSTGEAIVECHFIAETGFEQGQIYVKDGRYSDTNGSGGSVVCVDTASLVVADEDTTGIEETLASSADAEYYTIDGVKVAKENLTQGVYVKKVGNKASKVLVK